MKLVNLRCRKRSVAEFMQESIVFLVRVQRRCKESSRSLSHLLMSFLLLRHGVYYSATTIARTLPLYCVFSPTLHWNTPTGRIISKWLIQIPFWLSLQTFSTVGRGLDWCGQKRTRGKVVHNNIFNQFYAASFKDQNLTWAVLNAVDRLNYWKT